MPIVRQRIIAAYLTRQEIVAQAQGLASVDTAAAKAEFWARYRIARSRLSSLQPLPNTQPAFDALPASADDYIEALKTTDSFQENFGGLDTQFHSVPIDRITPIQVFCNVEPEQPPPPRTDLERLLEYALPRDVRVPGETIVTPNGVRFSTPRYGLGLQNVRRRVRDGNVVLSFEHLNIIQVHRYGNILLLLNGTHRCLELQRAGHTHVPAMVIDHQNPSEFEGPVGPGFWPPQLLFTSPRQTGQGARPPLISDFGTDLSVECRVAIVPSTVEINFPTQPGGPIIGGPPVGQQIMIPFGGVVPQRIG
jgi:hypothetical protein